MMPNYITEILIEVFSIWKKKIHTHTHNVQKHLFHEADSVFADILEGYDAVESRNHALSAQLDALVDMKFTYVVTCQLFGSQKAAGDPHAQDLIDLMLR